MSELLFQPKAASLNIATSRFIWFMISVEPPITEDKIFDYYHKHVAGSGRWNDALGWDQPEYKDHNGNVVAAKSQEPDMEKLCRYSILWFDNNLGRSIRRGLSLKKQDYIKKGERLFVKDNNLCAELTQKLNRLEGGK